MKGTVCIDGEEWVGRHNHALQKSEGDHLEEDNVVICYSREWDFID